jgi:hypothetical protein
LTHSLSLSHYFYLFNFLSLSCRKQGEKKRECERKNEKKAEREREERREPRERRESRERRKERFLEEQFGGKHSAAPS